jgi:integrase
MAIRQNADGTWTADVRVDGKRKRKTFPNYNAAEIFEQEQKQIQHKSRMAKKRASITPTMKDVYEAELKREGTKWNQPVSKPRRNCELVLTEMEWWQRPVDSITDDDLQECWNYYRKIGNSESTINRKKSALHVLFNLAHKRGYIRIKPEALSKVREGQGRIRFLTRDEERELIELLEHLGMDNYKHFVIVLLDTGLRVSEALSLSRSDYDGERIYVHDDIVKKNGSQRIIPLSKRCSESLEWLFKHDFKGISQSRFNDVWADRIRPMMGLTNDSQFVPHALRHTCASRLVMGGMGLKQVQAWMGHKSLQTTLRYVHLCPKALEGGAKILEEQSAYSETA